MPHRESSLSISDALAPPETQALASLYHHIFRFSPLNRPKPTPVTLSEQASVHRPRSPPRPPNERAVRPVDRVVFPMRHGLASAGTLWYAPG